MIRRAIIFDLDGTLLDTLSDIAAAANSALADFGLAEHTIQEYRKMIGNGLERLAQRALPNDKLHLTDELLENMCRYYNNRCLENTRPYDGIMEMLTQLRQRNIRLTVLTNKNQDMAQRLVNHFFGNRVFEKVVGPIDGKAVKPDSNATRKLVESMNLSYENFLFVGDSPVDIDTAAAVGIRSVAVAWGFRDKAELQEHNADVIIDSPCELFALLT